MYISEQYLNELSYFVTPYVKKLINNIPTVTKKDFIGNVEPGDIVLGFSPRELKTVRTSKIIASVQRSPYTTSKIVADNKTIIGYGVKAVNTVDENFLRTYQLRNLLIERHELCLIRINDATLTQKRKAIDFCLNRLGLEYNSSDLLKTIWNVFTRKKLFPFFRNEPLEKKEVDNLQRPLFCSSIIALGYWYAGYKHKFNGKSPYELWPIDFLIDDNTTGVCRVEQL